MMQLSQTLLVKEGQVHCRACDRELGPASQGWKNHTNLDEKLLHELGVPYTTSDKLRLRQFSCPGCGTLLDTELALPGDPFLEDQLKL